MKHDKDVQIRDLQMKVEQYRRMYNEAYKGRADAEAKLAIAETKLKKEHDDFMISCALADDRLEYRKMGESHDDLRKRAIDKHIIDEHPASEGITPIEGLIEDLNNITKQNQDLRDQLNIAAPLCPICGHELTVRGTCDNPDCSFDPADPEHFEQPFHSHAGWVNHPEDAVLDDKIVIPPKKKIENVIIKLVGGGRKTHPKHIMMDEDAAPDLDEQNVSGSIPWAPLPEPDDENKAALTVELDDLKTKIAEIPRIKKIIEEKPEPEKHGLSENQFEPNTCETCLAQSCWKSAVHGKKCYEWIASSLFTALQAARDEIDRLTKELDSFGVVGECDACHLQKRMRFNINYATGKPEVYYCLDCYLERRETENRELRAKLQIYEDAAPLPGDSLSTFERKYESVIESVIKDAAPEPEYTPETPGDEHDDQGENDAKTRIIRRGAFLLKP